MSDLGDLLNWRDMTSTNGELASRTACRDHGVWSRAKRHLMGWIGRSPEKQAHAARARNATIHPTARLGQEAAVENLSGRSDRISVGANSYIRGRLLTYSHAGRITIGQWCYVGVRSELWSMDSISIGERVLIAHDVNIHDGTAHSLDPAERHAHFRHIIEKGHPRMPDQLPGVRSGPVVIEDDVWISFGVTILKGVRIGAGSVIAAGSMVTGDVPPGTLYRCEITPVLQPLPV